MFHGSSSPSLRKFDASIGLLHKLRGVVVAVVIVVVVVVVVLNQIRGSTPVNYGLHRAPQKTDWIKRNMLLLLLSKLRLENKKAAVAIIAVEHIIDFWGFIFIFYLTKYYLS